LVTGFSGFTWLGLVGPLEKGQADDYLRKPLDGAEFQAALDRTISRLTLARHNVALRRQLGTKH